MSEFTLYKFCNLYEMSSGISSTPEQAGHGFPFLSFSVVFNNYFLPSKLPDLMNTSDKERKKYSIKEGDIFLTRTSEVLDELAMSSVATKDYDNATYSGFLKRLRPIQKNITYHKFMAFYLRSKFFRKTMENNAIMTLRASFNEQIFSYINLLIPPFSEQKKIGDFLFTIHQKIELNNRINTELEQMAKTLYDYWFVQFDFPNEEGKPYRASGGEMVYNEVLKREIPAGWEVGTLEEIINLEYGKPLKESDRSGNGFPVMGSNGIVGYHEKFLVKGPGIVVGRKGSAGEITWVNNNFFPIDTTYYITDKRGLDFLGFHYYLLKKVNLKKIESSSAVPGLNRNVVYSIKSEIPILSIVQRFSELVKPFFDKIAINEQQNQQLASLRDWLLPMLMNGQVTVGE
ncbi:restriction endonuclease subunit S [Siphonobacter sp. SORGH_AS_0500]|uniref:restriction endonuclease subunit S n=1 Tax=Siphonobacter sp. SORGH_AS_0500 TaxID=1864824 RepID=UPI00285FB7EA|nr:restriction endonuclease subunit S [Siphonobacter sp. SORGH_AS_0500]MDR6194057.1 type I restriction enzyme S subunit [Siphonobacter sp. SORGH_AS_0500]